VLVPGTEMEKALAVVPIMAGGQPVGLIYTGNYERENAYSESDVRLLTTLAASLGVSLENVRLFEQTRTLLAQTEQRAGELAVINSVQQGLASKLDSQAIIDLVGDKLCEVLGSQDLRISLYDRQANLLHSAYLLDQGQRLEIPPGAPSPTGLWGRVASTRRPLIVNENMAAYYAETNLTLVPGTEMEKCFAAVPILAGGEAIGLLTVWKYEREHAFGESEVRLMTTLAASLGVALENVRLFEQTRTLLAETEQRAGELAVINSVQQGLASKLEMQAIIDLVGDKLCEVLGTDSLSVRLYDRGTNQVSWPYLVERGNRLQLPTSAPFGLSAYVLRTCQPLVINENIEERCAELEMPVIEGTDADKSLAAVPIIAGG